jgi:hypothetical protein
MDSTIFTVEMLGTGGGNTQYLFLLLGFANSSDEPIPPTPTGRQSDGKSY